MWLIGGRWDLIMKGLMLKMLKVGAIFHADQFVEWEFRWKGVYIYMLKYSNA